MGLAFECGSLYQVVQWVGEGLLKGGGLRESKKQEVSVPYVEGESKKNKVLSSPITESAALIG